MPARKTKDPDQLPLTAIQAARLSDITGVTAKELAGVSHAELTERLKFRIDPLWWRFQRVCGRVVKRDPVTGEEYGVPNATVHVEDTDCSLLLYAPLKSPYLWFYPFRCKREVIATATTDACGRFCVWIPRWEIDWILRWRRHRICFPIIFDRPRFPDLEIDPRIPIPRIPPIPPIRVPELELRPGFALAARSFGELIEQDDAEVQLFEEELQPPLPRELTAVIASGKPNERPADTQELVHAALANRVGLDSKILKEIDLRHVIGPFRRCIDVFVPTWAPIFDVPDITFRVTQDVDGDGDEEQIYGEGYFKVRWDATNIGYVTLRTSPLARESRICNAPPVLPCGNVPAINFAGLMPVTAAYHDNVSGYAIRPNRPRLSGVSVNPATAPYCLNVNLFGCLPKIDRAAKYRLAFRYSPHSGIPFPATDPVPFTGHTWYWHPLGASPIQAVHTPGTGWYDLPPNGLAGTPEESFLFPFDTTRYAPGLYQLFVQLGDAAGNVLATSPEVRLMCDNRAPVIDRLIRWSRDGGATWTVLPSICPVVRRGVAPVDVLFDVTWMVMAPAHYRDSNVGASGCGAFGAEPVLDPLTQTTDDWHTGPNDNAMTYSLRYRLPSMSPEGTYHFGAHANSRAFNPSGYVAGYQTNDWLYDVPTSPIHNNALVSFSVINSA